MLLFTVGILSSTVVPQCSHTAGVLSYWCEQMRQQIDLYIKGRAGDDSGGSEQSKGAPPRVFCNSSSFFLGMLSCCCEQMRQQIDLYIKVAELETTREDLNRRKALPRELRAVKDLNLVPVITATLPVDPSCEYLPYFFPAFCGLSDSMR